MNKSYFQIISEEFAEEIKLTQFEVDVRKIEINEKVICYDNNNVKYGDFDYLVSSIPVSILKEIEFVPPLNDNKKNALKVLEHDDTAKLILKFNKKFWDAEMAIMYINSKIPVFWPSGKYYTNDDDNEFILTGMTSGENCRKIEEVYLKDKQEFISIICNDLKRCFNQDISSYLIDYYWFNWKHEKFAKGGYTFHSIGEGNSREYLRENHCDKVLFIGDALAINGHISTVHGAYEFAKLKAKILSDHLNLIN